MRKLGLERSLRKRCLGLLGILVFAAAGVNGCATTSNRALTEERCFQLQSEVYEAILKYQEDRKQIPRNLSELVPNYLSQIPTVESARRLAYRQDRRQFSIYCIFSDDRDLRRCEMTEDRRWNCKSVDF